MNREDIIRMAREAGAGHAFRYSGNNERRSVYRFHNNELERFAALVAAAEREECAKVCEKQPSFVNRYNEVITPSADRCAAAIRARGSK